MIYSVLDATTKRNTYYLNNPTTIFLDFYQNNNLLVLEGRTTVYP